MSLKGIIFDKDGTLIDFDAFWISVCREAMSRVLKSAGADLSLVDKILLRLGVKDGAADIDGILCSGTYEQMGEVACEIISSSGCPADREKIIEMTINEHKNCAQLGLVRPTCKGLKETLLKLKAEGLYLAIVTTDTKEITEMCLDALEIKELFDEIYCDDGIHPTKPDPYYALEFSKKYGIATEQIAMVGDTLTDMRFAKNAGLLAIGVGKSEKSRHSLAPTADLCIREITELCDGALAL